MVFIEVISLVATLSWRKNCQAATEGHHRERHWVRGCGSSRDTRRTPSSICQKKSSHSNCRCNHYGLQLILEVCCGAFRKTSNTDAFSSPTNSRITRDRRQALRQWRATLVGERSIRSWRVKRPNDPSSATRRTGRNDCNHDAPAGFAAAHG